MTNSVQYQNQLEQERFGLQVAARLSDATHDLPYDISERLRASRMQALSKRKVAEVQMAAHRPVLADRSSLIFGGDGPSWWDRLAAVVPLLTLVIGLIAITAILDDRRADELAEIDAELLIDGLPPTAYTDPGFAHFLKFKVRQIRGTGQNEDPTRI
jgi:hypothetical protein